MKLKPSEIREDCYYLKKDEFWPRLVVAIFGDRIAYIDPWNVGVCDRGTFAGWAGRPLDLAEDMVAHAGDLIAIEEMRARLSDHAVNRARYETFLSG